MGKLTISLEQKLGDSLQQVFFIHQMFTAVYHVQDSGDSDEQGVVFLLVRGWR